MVMMPLILMMKMLERAAARSRSMNIHLLFSPLPLAGDGSGVRVIMNYLVRRCIR